MISSKSGKREAPCAGTEMGGHVAWTPGGGMNAYRTSWVWGRVLKMNSREKRPFAFAGGAPTAALLRREQIRHPANLQIKLFHQSFVQVMLQ